jgi:hypothetical protein
MPKNTSLFHFSEQNCTIHQRTITQTHDLSRHYFSLKLDFFYKIPFFFHFIVIFIILPAKHFLSSPKKAFELHFQNFTP